MVSYYELKKCSIKKFKTYSKEDLENHKDKSFEYHKMKHIDSIFGRNVKRNFLIKFLKSYNVSRNEAQDALDYGQTKSCADYLINMYDFLDVTDHLNNAKATKDRKISGNVKVSNFLKDKYIKHLTDCVVDISGTRFKESDFTYTYKQENKQIPFEENFRKLGSEVFTMGYDQEDYFKLPPENYTKSQLYTIYRSSDRNKFKEYSRGYFNLPKDSMSNVDLDQYHPEEILTLSESRIVKYLNWNTLRSDEFKNKINIISPDLPIESLEKLGITNYWGSPQKVDFKEKVEKSKIGEVLPRDIMAKILKMKAPDYDDARWFFLNYVKNKNTKCSASWIRAFSNKKLIGMINTKINQTVLKSIPNPKVLMIK